MRRALILSALGVAIAAVAAAHAASRTILPGGWRLSPASTVVTIGAMPQGIALSPDGTLLAVIESGTPPAALRVLDSATLGTRMLIPLRGAFGKPLWLDNDHVLVPGAGTDAILDIDLRTDVNVRTFDIRSLPLDKGAWPVDLALAGNHLAVSEDRNSTSGSLSIGTGSLGAWSKFRIARAGSHPSELVFSHDMKSVYVALRGQSSVGVFSASTGRATRTIAVGSHPCALALSADGARLYAAVCDDDSVAVIDTHSNTRIARIPVGLSARRIYGYGANPNALLVRGGDLFVSLGGENAVALIRNNRVAGYIPAGWYPTGLAMGKDGTLFVSNGKGERAPANPYFKALVYRAKGYVADITVGSVRAIPRSVYETTVLETQDEIADLAPEWSPPASSILRKGGPIRHVIYIIKENRSYDQILGDLRGANGDPSLVMFGRSATPNQHALAERFGIFDNAYADAQVSADGHNWTDAATANDYVERTWPPSYGGRRPGYDSQFGIGADVPHSGYLWDAAKRAGITYRDYGEEDIGSTGPNSILTFPGLSGHFDRAYPGWNLHYSDLNRFAEWKREFGTYVARRTLPQLEIVYFPNDHTNGTTIGMPTPRAYIATNDWVTGRLVDAVSHSPYWRSTAIFILEDDAQNGPDHVSDQRSTFYVASPYARGGLDHSHYSTVSVVRSIELILGLPPLSVKDATTRPMYAAFTTSALNLRPFNAVKPSGDLNATNTHTAYGSALSARMNFRRPDAADPRILNDILMHAYR